MYSISHCLSGVVNNITFTVIDIFWFSHTLVLFWKVWYPFHSKYIEHTRYYKFIHLGILLLVLTLPWIPVAASFATGGYTAITYPAFNNCFAKNPDATFYSFIFPKCILFSIGITLIILVFWKLLKLAGRTGLKQVGMCLCVCVFVCLCIILLCDVVCIHEHSSTSHMYYYHVV